MAHANPSQAHHELVVSPRRLLHLIQTQQLAVGYMFDDLPAINQQVGVDVGREFSGLRSQAASAAAFFSVDLGKLAANSSQSELENLRARGVSIDGPAVQIFASSRSLATFGIAQFGQLTETLSSALRAISQNYQLERTPGEIAKLLEGQSDFILNIHTAWCSDCAEQKKNFGVVVDELQATHIPVYSMLAQIQRREYLGPEHGRLCERLKVTGFPFMAAFKSGEMVLSASDIWDKNALQGFASNARQLIGAS